MKLKAGIYTSSTLIQRHTIAFFSQLWAAALAAFVIGAVAAHAQVNDVGQKPYLGWSSFSEQTLDGSFLTQTNIRRSRMLWRHQVSRITASTTSTSTRAGRAASMPTAAHSQYDDLPRHQGVNRPHPPNGQKAGIYWIPGVEYPAVDCQFPDSRNAIPHSGHPRRPLHGRQRVWRSGYFALSLQDRLHQARIAGVHELGGRTLRVMGSGPHQTRWRHSRLLQR